MRRRNNVPNRFFQITVRWDQESPALPGQKKSNARRISSAGDAAHMTL